MTLSSSQDDNGQPEGFKPPDFRGLRVLGGPFMQTSMNMVMGGSGSKIENNTTWSYQLSLPPGARGSVTIGAAHVRAGGHDLSANSVAVRVGAAAAPAPPQRRAPGLFPRGFFDEPEADEQAVSSSASAAFVRAVADKRRAFVGEQVTVTWYLYLAEPQSNFQAVTQPKADGFWSEDLPSTNPQGRLAFTDQVEGGQHYQVAVRAAARAVSARAREADGHADGGAGVALRLLRTRGQPAAPQVRPADDRGGRAAARGTAGAASPRATSGASRSTSPSIARRSLSAMRSR